MLREGRRHIFIPGLYIDLKINHQLLDNMLRLEAPPVNMIHVQN